MGRQWRLRITMMLFTLLLGVSSVTSLSLPVHAQEVRDCDDNAVIRCGALSEAELITKYRENQQGNVQSLYRQFNIPNEASLSRLVEGSVDTNNNVYVGNRLVGRNAMTAGRQNISNSNGSSTPILNGAMYMRSPSVSFAQPNSSLRALVKMENDSFRYAVITSCGNPVNAEAVQPVKQPVKKYHKTSVPVKVKTVKQHPSFTLNKYVRSERHPQWQSEIAASPGENVQFKIQIKNTGDSTLTNITVTDELPDGLQLESGSLQTVSGASGELFSTLGTNAGSLAVNQTIEITFDATVESGVEACKAKQLRNVARAKADEVSERIDAARVEVCPHVVKRVVQPVVKDTKVETPTRLVNTGSNVVFAGFMISAALGTALRYLVGFYQQWLQRFGM